MVPSGPKAIPSTGAIYFKTHYWEGFNRLKSLFFLNGVTKSSHLTTVISLLPVRWLEERPTVVLDTLPAVVSIYALTLSLWLRNNFSARFLMRSSGLKLLQRGLPVIYIRAGSIDKSLAGNTLTGPLSEQYVIYDHTPAKI
jgi:hypothetical protein